MIFSTVSRMVTLTGQRSVSTLHPRRWLRNRDPRSLGGPREATDDQGNRVLEVADARNFFRLPKGSADPAWELWPGPKGIDERPELNRLVRIEPSRPVGVEPVHDVALETVERDDSL